MHRKSALLQPRYMNCYLCIHNRHGDTDVETFEYGIIRIGFVLFSSSTLTCSQYRRKLKILEQSA